MDNNYNNIRHKIYSAMFALREVKRDSLFYDVCLKGQAQYTIDEFLKIELLLNSLISNIDLKENAKTLNELGLSKEYEDEL